MSPYEVLGDDVSPLPIVDIEGKLIFTIECVKQYKALYVAFFLQQLSIHPKRF